MKKVLAVLAIVFLMASSVFAVTVTKEIAKGGLPGYLYNEASLTSAAAFPSTLGLLGNLASLDYIYGDAVGSLVTKSDLGVLGLIISPNQTFDLDGVSVWQVSNKAMLAYATSMEGMAVGGNLTIGMRNFSAKDLDVEANGYNPDVVNDSRLLLGLKAGVSILGDSPVDAAIGFTMANESDTETNDYQPSGNLAQEDIEANSYMDISLAGRTKIAGWMLVVDADYLMGSEKVTQQIDNDNDGTLETDSETVVTNSKIAAKLLAANTIKASETLSVTVGTGLQYEGTSDYKQTVKNKVADTEALSGNTWTEATLDIPLWVAVEGKLNETWTVLSGVSTTLLAFDGYGEKYDDDAAADAQDMKPYYEETWLDINPSLGTPGLNFTVGLEGKIGDLTLDLNLNPVILIAGPNLISGGSFNMNTAVALSYAWK